MSSDKMKPDEAPVDLRRALWLGGLVLALGMGFVFWAGFAPLDEGVPAPATIVVESRSHQVQHLAGGLVSRVAVKEGQRVSHGDVLVQVDNTEAKANLDSLVVQWISTQALAVRLSAEQQGLRALSLPAELMVAPYAALARPAFELQDRLLASRRNALDADIGALEQSYLATQANIVGLTQSAQARDQQLALLEQELSATRLMVNDGYLARTRQFELERQVADLNASLADLRANKARMTESLAEIRFRQQQRKHDFRKELETQLTEARRDVGMLTEKVRAANEQQARNTLRAPVAGSVVGLAFSTAGGVVAPGGRLMEIVPDNATLVLEAQIPPPLIDRIQAGQMADVHLRAFVNLPQLVLQGKVISVSATSITDPNTHQSYYLARVQVTPEGLRRLQGHELQPGMPADVVVITGERSVLNYLLRPLLRRLSETMKEA